MDGIATCQCSNCGSVYLPSVYAHCPSCGIPSRITATRRRTQPAVDHAWFVESASRNPRVVAFRAECTAACASARCRLLPQLLTIRAAMQKLPLPCREPFNCYGALRVVFRDELSPEQLELIAMDSDEG